MSNKVTIRDVAERAGVSVATVSNVLNNNLNKVSETTRKKVRKTIKELDYQPNFTARTLANKKSNLIGIMLPLTKDSDLPSTLLRDNPFYSEFISGIELSARQGGYDVLITGISEEQSYKGWIIKRNLDGIIFLGIYPDRLFKEIKGIDIPLVFIDTYGDYTSQFHNIGVNDKQGGYLAAEHLLELGHRNIALATGNMDSSDINFTRYLGYQKALKEYELRVDEELIFEEDVSFSGGYEIGKKLLKTERKISAVFAVADILAFGVMKAFHDNDRKIPDNLSIIGFDDLKMCQYLFPGLTTIKQDILKKGMIAADTIIEEIEDRTDINKNISLPLELVIRDSTAAVDG